MIPIDHTARELAEKHLNSALAHIEAASATRNLDKAVRERIHIARDYALDALALLADQPPTPQQ
jgi:hypothetical protein